MKGPGSEESVLVTGGAGYVGSHVVLALREAGYGVTVIDDLSSGRREAVPGDVPLVRADIGDGRALRSTLKEHAIGAVVHLAARVGVAESLSRRGDPPALVAETGRIRAALGWSPRLDGVDASVATTLRWLREPGRRGCDGGAAQ